ncbi:MAG: hypothetical protein NTX98_00910 [Candidatus Doudnabacteria bacterium]|nr:hypothetical protein [Candidatus Doudnabacteria bacterium]
MSTIIPAILETTKADFSEKLNLVTKLPSVERIQVDFGDGEFVPNRMLSVSDIDLLNPAFTWEAHLMVKEPKDFFDYQICGFKIVLIHTEAYSGETEVFDAIAKIRALKLEPGLCLNPQTPVEFLKKFEGKVSQFLLLGVNPGLQGQVFMPETLERIKILRKLIPDAKIEVDGGINETNIKSIANAGADLLVVGSALVKAPNILEAYENLQKELNKN